jgi:hypothetical protein
MGAEHHRDRGEVAGVLQEREAPSMGEGERAANEGRSGGTAKGATAPTTKAETKAPAKSTVASPTLGMPRGSPSAMADADASGAPLPSASSVTDAIDGDSRKRAARRDTARVKRAAAMATPGPDLGEEAAAAWGPPGEGGLRLPGRRLDVGQAAAGRGAGGGGRREVAAGMKP